MQILPAKELSDIIKHYLFLDSKGINAKNLRLFSDGNTGIVFNTNNNLFLDFNNKLPNSFLYGQITQFKDIYFSNYTSLIIVVFQPAGIKKKFGISAFEVCDNIIDLEEISGKKSLEIEDKLAEAKTIQEKINLLNAFFIALALKNNIKNELLISASINFILKNKGLISNSQLIKFTGYTERHIERLFLESIGISPKSFANIVKLHSFLQQIKTNTKKTNLTEIAYHAGYADQSHLIREFKKHTGMTPSLYTKKTYKLAINFVAFPIQETNLKL